MSDTRFYIVIRRKRDTAFRKHRWRLHLDWIYERFSEAIKVRDDARAKLPQFEFDVLHCNANGPKR